jgi:hypothetical protein
LVLAEMSGTPWHNTYRACTKTCLR